jgi:excisionase family DNA binding protein
MGLKGKRANRLWTPDEVSDYLGVPKATLAWWRTSGRGPGFLKVGRAVRYDPDEVCRYVEQCTEGAAW